MYHAENIGPLVESEREQEKEQGREVADGGARARISSPRVRQSAAVSGDKSSVLHEIRWRNKGGRGTIRSVRGCETKRACRVSDPRTDESTARTSYPRRTDISLSIPFEGRQSPFNFFNSR